MIQCNLNYKFWWEPALGTIEEPTWHSYNYFLNSNKITTMFYSEIWYHLRHIIARGHYLRSVYMFYKTVWFHDPMQCKFKILVRNSYRRNRRAQWHSYNDFLNSLYSNNITTMFYGEICYHLRHIIARGHYLRSVYMFYKTVWFHDPMLFKLQILMRTSFGHNRRAHLAYL
jgi:cytochrome c oxidase assembly factor CtaG